MILLFLTCVRWDHVWDLVLQLICDIVDIDIIVIDDYVDLKNIMVLQINVT